MKAFLSYQFNDNISAITNLLQEKGIDVFSPMTDYIDYGTSFQKAIKNAILECDFIIVIFTSNNPNIAFESGIAVCANKPIFAIISEECDFLLDSTYVYALPNEIDKIKFNLEIFLSNIKHPKKTTKIQKHKFYGGGFPNYYNEILNSYMSLREKNEKEYEMFFKDIFEKYHLDVIQQNKLDSKSNTYADFCVWSNNLSNLIGNPILIEIKKEINKNNLESIKEIVNKLITNNTAESCLIFYDQLKGINKKELPNTNKELFIQISDFIEKLNGNDFNESIRKIRNEIIHNQY